MEGKGASEIHPSGSSLVPLENPSGEILRVPVVSKLGGPCVSPDTNRKIPSVASAKGRAKLGLLVRIFLRYLDLRVRDEGIPRIGRDGVTVGDWLLLGGGIVCFPCLVE